MLQPRFHLCRCTGETGSSWAGLCQTRQRPRSRTTSKITSPRWSALSLERSIAQHFKQTVFVVARRTRLFFSAKSQLKTASVATDFFNMMTEERIKDQRSELNPGFNMSFKEINSQYVCCYRLQLGLDRMELPPSAIHLGQRRRKAEPRQPSSAAPITQLPLESGGLTIPETQVSGTETAL